jgi:inactivated superfamily I helicase
MTLQDREATQLEVDECETAIGDAIREAARLVLGVQNVRKHKSKLNIQALQEVKKQRRKAHSDDDWELLWIRYQNLHAAEKKCLKSETKLAFDQFSHEFSEKGSTEQSKILRRIMTVKKGMSANCVSTVESNMEKYRLYFQDMFRKEAQTDESLVYYNNGVNSGDESMQGVRNTFATNEEIWNCVCQCQAGGTCEGRR